MNMWIEQSEHPGFLPQQIVSLEEVGEDDGGNECVWISASKKIVH